MLKRVITIIAVVQIVLGVILLVPDLPETALRLESAPGWVNWLLAMAAARSLGFGYGMLVAARSPERHLPWIRAMIGVQAIDWIGTIAYLVTGTVTLAQVSTAAFLPVIFIVVLVTRTPWSGASRQERSAAPV